MAKDTTTVSTRVGEIAAQIAATCGAIVQDEDARQVARDEANALGESVTATRVGIMSTIARLSREGNWTLGEINGACKEAVKPKFYNSVQDDRTLKTLATFVSEMSRMAHPKTRDDVSTIVQVCDAAWQAEQEILDACENSADRKSADTPIRKWQARKYHLMITLARHTIDDKFRVTTVADLTYYARCNDPDFDAEKVAKRIESMRDQISKLYNDFGHTDLSDCVDYLADLTAEKLLDARKSLLASRGESPLEPPQVAPRGSDAAKAPKPSSVPLRPAVAHVPEVISGAVAMDELLGSQTAPGELALVA